MDTLRPVIPLLRGASKYGCPRVVKTKSHEIPQLRLVNYFARERGECRLLHLLQRITGGKL